MRIGQIIKLLLLICNLLSLFFHSIYVVPQVVFSILYIFFKLKIYTRNQEFYYYWWQRFKYLKFCSDVINLFIWLFSRHLLSIYRPCLRHCNKQRSSIMAKAGAQIWIWLIFFNIDEVEIFCAYSVWWPRHYLINWDYIKYSVIRSFNEA